eukprot:7970642-Ditylum_brightwellii.AAC.1
MPQLELMIPVFGLNSLNFKNLAIDGGIYADNHIQIESDKRVDDVCVLNTQMIGFLLLYQIEVEA